MQKRPITIALAIAGLIAGTTAGIAAINSDATPIAAPAAPMATQPVAEVKTAAESQLVVETQAPADVIAQAPAEGTAPARMVTAPARTPAPPAARSTSDESMVRVPFTNYYVRVTNPTFPNSGLETPDTLPATVAYFDRMEAARYAASQPAPAPVTTLDLPQTAGTTLQTASPTTQASISGN